MSTPKPRSRPLTLKQRPTEYDTPRKRRYAELRPFANSNAEAARQAGYSPVVAREMGSENLTKPSVQAMMEAVHQAATSQKVASVIKRKEYLSSIPANMKAGPYPAQVAIDAIAELNKMERVYGEPPARDSALEWLLELRKLMAAAPAAVDQEQAPRLLLPGDEEREALPHAPQHDDKAPKLHRSDAA